MRQIINAKLIHKEGHSLLLSSKLISDRHLNGSFDIHTFQLIKRILRNTAPPDRQPCSPTPVATHIVSDETLENRHSDFNRDGEGNVVEDSEAGR